MPKITLPIAAIALAVAPVLFAAPAGAASLNHTWVAFNGFDTNNCDRTTPCATFAGAYGKTTAGGEITCIDSEDYGGLTISKSITINCEAARGSSTYPVSLLPGSIIVATAVTDVVTLRGLDVDGLGLPVFQGPLISFTGAGALHVDKVRLNGLPGGTGATGIAFSPTGTARLFVSDSAISDNGTSPISGGIVIKPAAGVDAEVTINRTQIENNLFGVVADGTAGGTIRGVVRDSVVSGNGFLGIGVTTSGASVLLLVDNTTVTGSSYGLIAVGAGGGIAVGKSSIVFNNTGLYAATGGVLVSYKNNNVNGNTTTDGMFSSTAAQQ